MSEQQKEQQLLETVDRIIAEGPYQPAWSSLMQTKTPDWFKQKRFGIFIHWGVYSVPANSNEWYPRNMYIEGMPAYEHHIKTYGSQKDFGYKDFIPMFHAEKFDPAEWVRLFKEAGAGFYGFEVRGGKNAELLDSAIAGEYDGNGVPDGLCPPFSLPAAAGCHPVAFHSAVSSGRIFSPGW